MDCPPVYAYAIFLIALAIYDIYMGSFPSLARTIFYLIFGVILLWILCAAGMAPVGWALLAVPVIFYIFLFAILIFQKGFDFQTKSCTKPVEPTCEPECEDKSEECNKCEDKDTEVCKD